jgi:hypothetical protein
VHENENGQCYKELDDAGQTKKPGKKGHGNTKGNAKGKKGQGKQKGQGKKGKGKSLQGVQGAKVSKKTAQAGRNVNNPNLVKLGGDRRGVVVKHEAPSL